MGLTTQEMGIISGSIWGSFQGMCRPLLFQNLYTVHLSMNVSLDMFNRQIVLQIHCLIIALKSPLLKPKTIDSSNLLLFDFRKLFNKKEIDGYGAVFTDDIQRFSPYTNLKFHVSFEQICVEA